jgi:hypothetical protein
VSFVNEAVTATFIADHARRLLAASDETVRDLKPIYAAPRSAEIKLGAIVTL